MRLTALVLAAALLAPPATAAADNAVPPIRGQLVKQECGACHMAFQPVFLPAASWRRIMETLDNHFGEDASLDVGTRNQIASYLIAHAGLGSVDPANPPLRITELQWFRRQHSEGEIKWLRQERDVKTMADCVACHRGADRAAFGDD